MPGFGHSDGRPELIAPDASGAFLARLIDEWGLGAPHVVGPDVGTAAALFLAAKAPERVTSLTVGGGAVRFPIEAGGALKDIIEAPSLDVVRGLDARTNIGYAVEAGCRERKRARSPRGLCQRLRPRALRGVGPVRAALPRAEPGACAICCRRSPRRPRSWRGATMTSCRGRTTSTSTTSSRTARFILSTPVTSRGSKQRRNTAASSSTGSAADIGASARRTKRKERPWQAHTSKRRLRCRPRTPMPRRNEFRPGMGSSMRTATSAQVMSRSSCCSTSAAISTTGTRPSSTRSPQSGVWSRSTTSASRRRPARRRAPSRRWRTAQSPSSRRSGCSVSICSASRSAASSRRRSR